METALERINITDNMGFIQTPGFDLKLFSLPIDSWLTLAVPQNHVILLSFLFINQFPGIYSICRAVNAVRLYKEGNSERDLVWKTCGLTVPTPEVYEDRTLHVRLVRIRAEQRPEFRLLYTFHEQAKQPLRVHGSDLWNCSVPWWSEFQRHFLCNLEMECEGGEDEAQCFYTGHCGQGFLTLENRCYQYINRIGEFTTWRGSNLDCGLRGGYLASLNTPAEWNAVVAALRARRTEISIYMGFYFSTSVMPVRYSHVGMWADQTVAYFANYLPGRLRYCGRFGNELRYDSSLDLEVPCDFTDYANEFLCEFDSPQTFKENNVELHLKENFQKGDIGPSPRGNESGTVWLVKCPAGHLTHAFLACDDMSSCWLDRRGFRPDSEEGWGVPSRASCPAPLTSLPAMFACAESKGSGLGLTFGSGSQRVPYTMVCDHRRQCVDGSDESFCVFPPCSVSKPIQCDASAQCIPVSAVCNKQQDCSNGADEAQCKLTVTLNRHAPPPPAVIRFNPHPPDASSVPYFPLFITPLTPSSSNQTLADPCPETHFQCRNDGYCLPAFLRCNDINDCPGREDEAGCADRTVLCPGFYRCRASSVCLHPSHVCDGAYQCPQNDDELFCAMNCPAGCTCHGLAFTCRYQPFRADLYTEVRYVDAGGSGMSLARFRENVFLVHLSLTRCGLGNLEVVTFPNLRRLDLSHNELHIISPDDLREMTNLRFLSLAHNRLKAVFSSRVYPTRSIPSIESLDLSGVRIPRINTHSFAAFPGLRSLNLSKCGVRYVTGGGLGAVLKDLEVLDATGCPMTQFPRDLVSTLDHLRSMRSDNFKLCCSATLPAGFHLINCQAPVDEVSSCESLLRSDVYRAILPVFASLALLGNFGCFLLRSFCLKSSATGFGVFVTHLSISDFLMGVYLAVIGVSDRLYMRSYLWEDVLWRHSTACGAAGFLSLLSNEVSAFIICLITLDRFLVLRFPFSLFHFKSRSAHVACFVIWVVAMVMATIPLTPPLTSRWSFYSQTGICIPLPVTRRDFAGRHYSFGILIVFNFILFLIIAAGQAVIYASIQSNTMLAVDSTKKSNDLRIARRLITVAVSDFLCWFPIGLLGLLASSGVPIPGEINVGMAILVLPLNSSINPFLYTINVVLERRERSRDQKLSKQLAACHN